MKSAAILTDLSGRGEAPTRRIIDENSLCRIYSMTKPVTAIAAMMLIEDGLLALDQPLAEDFREQLRERSLYLPSASSGGEMGQLNDNLLYFSRCWTEDCYHTTWIYPAKTDRAHNQADRKVGVLPVNGWKTQREEPGRCVQRLE